MTPPVTGRNGARLACGAAFALIAAGLLVGLAAAQDIRFLRIGTGSTGATYFPIGGLIASAVSNPPGSLPCEKGGSCGMPGMIVITQSTQGSVENVAAVATGALETALTQADIAFFAYFGGGVFAGKGELKNLRAIANLFPEKVHIVVRRDSGITTVAGLKGKRVNVGEPGSGTLVGARVILGAYGLADKDITPFNHSVGRASDLLRSGGLDAYFMVGGAPISAVSVLADSGMIGLLPIEGKVAERIRKEHPFYAPAVIEEGTYRGIAAVPTLSVGAQWVTRAELADAIVYGLTRALWHDNSRRILDGGHPQGKHIQLKRALDGVAIPVHPGALRYYEEKGLTRAPIE